MQKYFESKTDSYSNNKRKLFIYEQGFITALVPKKIKKDENILYWLEENTESKEIDEENLKKHFKEILKDVFDLKLITDIPTNY